MFSIRTLSSYSLRKTFWVPDGNQTRNLLIAGDCQSASRNMSSIILVLINDVIVVALVLINDVIVVASQM